MLAIVYLFVMVALGDAICRRFYAFVSLPHRFAAAFLSGLLISTWWTYAAAWLFSGFASPMLWGDLAFFITSIGLILWLRQLRQKTEPSLGLDLGTTEFERAARTRPFFVQFVVTSIVFFAVFLSLLALVPMSLAGTILLVVVLILLLLTLYYFGWDYFFVALSFVFVCWQAFATFDMTDGRLQIAHHQWSDFGSNVSIMQTFALGNNFPTEYPHYSGEHIHYHFLFYFAAGNLEYLGLNPAVSNNILFILSTISMLVLVMTLGVVLFTSKVIGRIAAVIFFFHGSLSFIPFLFTNGLANAWGAISNTRDFLPSGFPYRGELWGVWSQVVFINQRHLASSVGIFLVVVVFILLRNRAAAEGTLTTPAVEAPPPVEPVRQVEAPVAAEPLPDEPAERSAAKPKRAKRGPKTKASESTDIGDIQEFVVKSQADEKEPPANSERTAKKPTSAKKVKPKKEPRVRAPKGPSPFANLFKGSIDRISPWIFSGVLLGLMPMWNGAVFMAAGAVLVLLLLLYRLRRELFILGVTSGIIALPQLIYLRTWGTNVPPPSFSLLHWGYTIDDPTIFNVLYYLLFTFGFKWLLIAVALVFAKTFQRKFFIAISVLIAVAFCMQFSDEVLANHKFLNVWLIMANVFAAFGLWFIWNLSYLKNMFLGKILAVILTVLITVGGVIDLFPIHNSFWMEMGFVDDPLVKWVTENTDPKSIFLSYHYVNHRILLAGRRLYFGHPYYAWSAGYPTFQRNAIYRRMFEETNPQELLRLLKENNISYVAIDNDVRTGDVTKNLNEAVYQAYFTKVYDDTENKYNSLKIYKVPDAIGAANPGVPVPGASPGEINGVNAFQSGSGSGPGQFSKPRGLATDSKGNIYVADFGNSRLERFDADGKFVAVLGSAGEGEGQFKEPNGIAVDAAGNVWAVDAAGDKSKLVKYGPDGKFVKEWKGPPENTLYGPRDIAIGPNKALYIVDQGRGRILKFDPANESFTEFGALGSGEGQFHEASGIAIADKFVVVADAGNNRIEVFDLDGKFVKQWNVPLWQFDVDPWHYPDVVYDEVSKKLYVSSGWTSEIVAYSLDGNLMSGGFKPEGDADKLDNPSSLAISEVNKKRRLLVLNTGGNKLSSFDLGPSAAAKTPK